VLDAPADRVDAFRFRAAVAAAGKPSAAPERSAALRNALELWRGDALSGIGDSDPRRSMAAGLERLRLTALEQRVAADLDAGRHEELGAELAELVARYPTHEPFATAAMLAAWRSGRRGDALAEYDGLRARLADELGIDPGPDAQALFARILRDDAIPPDAGPHSGRSQLPARVRIFEGRADRLAELDRLATDEARVPVVVISGMGGVGKTALAVQWAGSAAARFPDGQFYVDLRGFDGRQPLSALEALTRLLIAAGVPPERVPSEPDAAASTYRALLADRRAIVVLDNARSSAQVRELLPGTTPGRCRSTYCSGTGR
jgi:hypothetical protein